MSATAFAAASSSELTAGSAVVAGAVGITVIDGDLDVGRASLVAVGASVVVGVEAAVPGAAGGAPDVVFWLDVEDERAPKADAILRRTRRTTGAGTAT
jgi:hypothetical protein